MAKKAIDPQLLDDFVKGQNSSPDGGQDDHQKEEMNVFGQLKSLTEQLKGIVAGLDKALESLNQEHGTTPEEEPTDEEPQEAA